MQLVRALPGPCSSSRVRSSSEAGLSVVVSETTSGRSATSRDHRLYAEIGSTQAFGGIEGFVRPGATSSDPVSGRSCTIARDGA